MVGYISDTDVFVRTELGSKELGTRQDAIIPREARTLLILIDGQKSYAQVAEPLRNRKIYQASGGVLQYMQLLFDLEYITHKSSVTAKNNTTDTSQVSAYKELLLTEKAPDAVVDFQEKRQSRLAKQSASQTAESSNENSGAINTAANAGTEVLRGIIANLIDKHATAEQANLYKSKLDKCGNMRCIFDLIQEMQRVSTGDLEVALYLTALAFKKSKVDKTSVETAAAS